MKKKIWRFLDLAMSHFWAHVTINAFVIIGAGIVCLFGGSVDFVALIRTVVRWGIALDAFGTSVYWYLVNVWVYK